MSVGKRPFRQLRTVQPDYTAWQSVRVGMSRSDVQKILGAPPRSRIITGKPYVCYGWISSPSFPPGRPYSFIIGFDKNEKVFLKKDPFGGNLSMDGTPSIPQIIIPAQNALFSHYPRILDIRWNPSSGQYPMIYEVELGVTVPAGIPGHGEYSDLLKEHLISEPYFAFQFCGSQPGRIRIRGQNSLGKSEWSEFRNFDFSSR